MDRRYIVAAVLYCIQLYSFIHSFIVFIVISLEPEKKVLGGENKINLLFIISLTTPKEWHGSSNISTLAKLMLH